MNKKYIDFVPAKPVANSPERKKVRRTIVATEVEEVAVEAIFEERKRPVGVSTGLKKPKFGVIEDLQPKFVRTEVAKKPLGIVAKAKAKKVKMSAKDTARLDKIFETTLKEVEATSETKKKREKVEKEKTEKEVVKLPKMAKSPFVNTEKVDKRPLSKNVYQKKIVVPKEEPSGPVTIIAKPEKDSRVGMVVAIILTIILGATAGTVAFLLLPK